jgi:hypothetical protein
MGNCCAGDEKKGNITVGKKGAGALDVGAEEIEGSDNIFDYTNDRVKKIIDDQGEYDPGSWKSDGASLEDRGLCSLENNAKYQGKWDKKNSVRHGYGIQVWSDGSMYQGFWKADKANGNGRLIHADGDIYEGDWKDDKAHGTGVYKHTDGAEYDGDWKEDK